VTYAATLSTPQRHNGRLLKTVLITLGNGSRDWDLVAVRRVSPHIAVVLLPVSPPREYVGRRLMELLSSLGPIN